MEAGNYAALGTNMSFETGTSIVTILYLVPSGDVFVGTLLNNILLFSALPIPTGAQLTKPIATIISANINAASNRIKYLLFISRSFVFLFPSAYLVLVLMTAIIVTFGLYPYLLKCIMLKIS